MSDPTVLELVQRAQREPMKERRATLLLAVEAADALNDLDLGFEIRKKYIQACHSESNTLHMVAHYGWCLARHDDDPQRFPMRLWEYKWVVDAARGYSGVSRQQLSDLTEDMAVRFEAVGGSKGPASVARALNAAVLGDEDLAERVEEWLTVPKAGSLNDCATCDLANTVELLGDLGRHDDALAEAAPIIEGGRRCATQPHGVFAVLLRSCRATEASVLGDELSIKGLELIRNDPDFTTEFGLHLCHLAVGGKLQQGLDVLRRTAGVATGSELVMLDYTRGVRMMLRLADAHGVDDLVQLHSQFDGEAERLAGLFDQRNGNNHTSGLLTGDDDEMRAALSR